MHIEELRKRLPQNFMSIYDEEALTAQQLSGLTAAKVNEVVAAMNAVLDWVESINEEITNSIDSTVADIVEGGLLKLDESLTQAGKAADAASVGSKIKTLQGNVASKASILDLTSVADEVDTVAARISNLAKLSSGSTTGDAELADGRVGYNSKTYSTIGDAIRGQIEWLEKATPKNYNYLPDGESLDNIAKNSIYYLLDGRTYTSTPSDLKNGLVVTYVTENTNSRLQTFYGRSDGTGLYIRRYIASGWTEWAKLATENNTMMNYGVLGDGKNLDAISRNSIYYVLSGNSYTGLPSDVTSGFVVTYVNDEQNSKMQLFHGYANGSGLYTRRYVRESWSDWNKFALEGSASGTAGRAIRVLAIGNSFNQDAMAYLPPILQEICPGAEITIGICYTGSATLTQHVDWFGSNTPYAVYSEWTPGATSWARHSDKITLAAALERRDWDIITIQSNSDMVLNDSMINSEVVAPARELMRLLQTNARTPFSLLWWQWMSRPTGDYTALDMFNKIVYATNKVMEKVGVRDYIPVGAAIQSARTHPVLGKLGGGGDMLHTDARHMNAGIPALLAAYVAALKIAEWAGYKASGVYSSSFMPTASQVVSMNASNGNGGGMTHGDPVGVTTINVQRAQEIATLAVMHPDKITDCSTMG